MISIFKSSKSVQSQPKVKKGAFQDMFQNILKLFRISQVIGRSLDAETNAKSFLKTVMSIYDLNFGAVWLKGGQAVGEDVSWGSFSPVYAHPLCNVNNNDIVLSSVFHKLAFQQEFLVLDWKDTVYHPLFMERGLNGGELLLVRLEDIGWVELHSYKQVMNSLELNKLRPVFEKFAQTMKACLAHQQTLKTQTLLKELELSRSEAQQKLIDQLKENEKLHLSINQELEAKVLERTEEIMAHNKALNQQKQQIEQFNHELEDQKQDLEVAFAQLHKKSEELRSKNRMMTDSIRYAQTIQDALLPMPQDLKATLDEFFISYRPKDIVSGDFYWYEYIPAEEGNSVQTFIACVDCTGHGVPGAFMTLIGSRVLTEAVRDAKLREPNEILEMLDREIRASLKQGANKLSNQDGMDLSLCRLEYNDKGEMEVTFAGSKACIYYYKAKEEKIHRLSGDRRAIGGIKHAQKELSVKPFTNHKLYLKPSDMLYLSTDGLIDQNNPDRKKFGTRQFLQLLESIGKLSVQQQKGYLEMALDNHKQSEEQRDDITVLGIKV